MWRVQLQVACAASGQHLQGNQEPPTNQHLPEIVRPSSSRAGPYARPFFRRQVVHQNNHRQIPHLPIPKKATLTRTIEVVEYAAVKKKKSITLNVLLTDKFHLETVAKAVKEAMASDEDFVLLDKSNMLLGGTSYTREFWNSNSHKVKAIAKAQYDKYLRN